MASVTTDRARALTGKNVGLLKLINDKIKAELTGHDLRPLHCIIHQESLCKGALNIRQATNSIVNVFLNVDLRIKSLSIPALDELKYTQI